MDNSSGEEVQPYKYNGKEYETIADINLYDYHARQHDPILGRFTSIDPLTEKYYSWSPYAYCARGAAYGDPSVSLKIYRSGGSKAELDAGMAVYGLWQPHVEITYAFGEVFYSGRVI